MRVGDTLYSKHVYYEHEKLGLVVINFYYVETGVFLVSARDRPDSAGSYVKPSELTATRNIVPRQRRAS